MRALIALSTAVALATMLLGVSSPVQVARIYVLALLGLAGSIAARRTLSGFGRLERTARHQAVETEAPPFFERAIRRIELANASGVYFEQLRPRLREIAEQRLASRGSRSRDEELWLALESQRGGDKFEPPPEEELRRMIEALERI